MKTVVISGKANTSEPFSAIRERFLGAEIWACGTDSRDGADLYFELHGIETRRENAVQELPNEVYELGLPINNTICGLCAFAWLRGFEKVEVVGSPLDSDRERLDQRAALAYVVGWLNGRGCQVHWSDLPQNKNYGKKEAEYGR